MNYIVILKKALAKEDMEEVVIPVTSKDGTVYYKKQWKKRKNYNDEHKKSKLVVDTASNQKSQRSIATKSSNRKSHKLVINSNKAHKSKFSYTEFMQKAKKDRNMAMLYLANNGGTWKVSQDTEENWKRAQAAAVALGGK